MDNDISLILLCAGESSRFKFKIKKQWLRIGDVPLWQYVANNLASYYNFKKIIIVTHKDELDYMKRFDNSFIYTQGGDNRQGSVKNGLDCVDTKYTLISDVARACIPQDVVKNMIKHKNKANCIVPYLDVTDTVVYNGKTINRDEVKLIQTPQLCDTNILKKALLSYEIFTDDSSAVKNSGGTIHYIKGSIKSEKLTFNNQLNILDNLLQPNKDIFVGTGYDIHQFKDGKKMFLGGIELPYDYGFKAHSDGDVLIHSIIDALLGAIGGGDIGEFFPDNDDKYKDISSSLLLKYIVDFVNKVGYEIINVDTTIIAQIPKINPYKNDIRLNLTKLLNLPNNKINIKATTAEKLDDIGKNKGIAVQSIVSLKYFDWKTL